MSRYRAIPLAVLLFLVGGLLGACTDQPFSEGAQVAIGVFEESFGDDYSLSAEQLTAEWTFDEAAPFTLSFENGTVTYTGTALEPGCYSGESEVGAVLDYEQAENVEFTTPDSDSACDDLP